MPNTATQSSASELAQISIEQSKPYTVADVLRLCRATAWHGHTFRDFMPAFWNLELTQALQAEPHCFVVDVTPNNVRVSWRQA